MQNEDSNGEEECGLSEPIGNATTQLPEINMEISHWSKRMQNPHLGSFRQVLPWGRSRQRPRPLCKNLCDA